MDLNKHDSRNEEQEREMRENWMHPQPRYQDPNGNMVPNPNYPNPGLGGIGFLEAVKMCFIKYADFNGRAPRAEYWWWFLFTFILGLAVGWLPVIGWIVSFGILVPNLAVSWRRLHDIDKAGGWWFIGLIPIVGWIILLVWFCQEGEPRPNRFGPNPYGLNFP